MTHRTRMPRRRHAGFSFVEALVCMLLLATLGAIAAALLPVTRDAAHVQENARVLGLVRAKLEELNAAPAMTTSGVDTFAVAGMRLPRRWATGPIDLDGDGTTEPDAFWVRVELAGVGLETIRSNPAGLDALRR